MHRAILIQLGLHVNISQLKDPSEEPEIDQLSETVDFVTSYEFGMYEYSSLS